MNDDLISRKALAKYFDTKAEEAKKLYDNGAAANTWHSAYEAVIDADAIDAEPVRHAAWQYEISFEDESKRDDFDVTCTGCGALLGAETRDDVEIFIMGRWDYCPFCGAKMDLEVEHEL